MTILNKKKRDNIEDILNTFELSAIQQSSAQEQGDHKTYNKFQKIIGNSGTVLMIHFL